MRKWILIIIWLHVSRNSAGSVNESGISKCLISTISRKSRCCGTKPRRSSIRCCNIARAICQHICSLPARDVAEIFQQAKHDIISDLLNDLNDKNLLILKAALNDSEKHVKSVYQRYKTLSQHFGEEPFSYVSFYNNLSYLQSIGLLLLISTKIARSYTNRIQLLFNAETFLDVFVRRFG